MIQSSIILPQNGATVTLSVVTINTGVLILLIISNDIQKVSYFFTSTHPDSALVMMMTVPKPRALVRHLIALDVWFERVISPRNQGEGRQGTHQRRGQGYLIKEESTLR